MDNPSDISTPFQPPEEGQIVSMTQEQTPESSIPTPQSNLQLAELTKQQKVLSLLVCFYAFYLLFIAYKFIAVGVIFNNVETKVGALPFSFLKYIPVESSMPFVASLFSLMVFYSGLKIRTRSSFGYKLAVVACITSIIAMFVLGIFVQIEGAKMSNIVTQ